MDTLLYAGDATPKPPQSFAPHGAGFHTQLPQYTATIDISHAQTSAASSSAWSNVAADPAFIAVVLLATIYVYREWLRNKAMTTLQQSHNKQHVVITEFHVDKSEQQKARLLERELKLLKREYKSMCRCLQQYDEIKAKLDGLVTEKTRLQSKLDAVVESNDRSCESLLSLQKKYAIMQESQRKIKSQLRDAERGIHSNLRTRNELADYADRYVKQLAGIDVRLSKAEAENASQESPEQLSRKIERLTTRLAQSEQDIGTIQAQSKTDYAAHRQHVSEAVESAVEALKRTSAKLNARQSSGVSATDMQRIRANITAIKSLLPEPSSSAPTSEQSALRVVNDSPHQLVNVASLKGWLQLLYSQVTAKPPTTTPAHIQGTNVTLSELRDLEHKLGQRIEALDVSKCSSSDLMKATANTGTYASSAELDRRTEALAARITRIEQSLPSRSDVDSAVQSRLGGYATAQWCDGRLNAMLHEVDAVRQRIIPAANDPAVQQVAQATVQTALEDPKLWERINSVASSISMMHLQGWFSLDNGIGNSTAQDAGEGSSGAAQQLSAYGAQQAPQQDFGPGVGQDAPFEFDPNVCHDDLFGLGQPSSFQQLPGPATAQQPAAHDPSADQSFAYLDDDFFSLGGESILPATMGADPTAAAQPTPAAPVSAQGADTTESGRTARLGKKRSFAEASSSNEARPHNFTFGGDDLVTANDFFTPGATIASGGTITWGGAAPDAGSDAATEQEEEDGERRKRARAPSPDLGPVAQWNAGQE